MGKKPLRQLLYQIIGLVLCALVLDRHGEFVKCFAISMFVYWCAYFELKLMGNHLPQRKIWTWFFHYGCFVMFVIAIFTFYAITSG